MLPLAPADLAQAGGIVRCGGCGRTLNALSELYAYPPGNDMRPISSDGMPPLLKPRVEQGSVLETDQGERRISAQNTAETSDHSSLEDRQAGPILDFSVPQQAPPKWLLWFWPVFSLLMLGVLLLQLFGPESWRVHWSGLSTVPVEQIALSDVVHVISRDLHAHPSLNDAVIVSAVLINRSEQTVRWPQIEVRLFDASQQVIGERRLLPQEYLDAQIDQPPDFAPETRLPIVLEMVTEGTNATGFSLAFY